jgi:hypothetical protein
MVRAAFLHLLGIAGTDFTVIRRGIEVTDGHIQPPLRVENNSPDPAVIQFRGKEYQSPRFSTLEVHWRAKDWQSSNAVPPQIG